MANWLPRHTQSTSKFWGIIAVLIASMAISIVANWGHSQGAAAQQPTAASSDERPFSLGYVPRDAFVVIASRPSTLVVRPVLAPLRDQIEKLRSSDMPWGLALKDLRELTVAIVLSNQEGQPMPIVVLRFASPEIAAKFIAALGGNPQRMTFGQNTYVRFEPQECFCQVDETTILYSPSEAALRRSLAAGTAGASTANWVSQWATLSSKDAVIVVNTSMLRGLPTITDEVTAAVAQFSTARNDRPTFGANRLAIRLGPLWESSEYAVGSLAISDRIDLRIVTNSAIEDEAKEVHRALLTALSVMRNAISTARDSFASSKEFANLVVLKHLDVFDEVIERAQVARRENQVGVAIRVDLETTKTLASALASAIPAAKGTNDRSLSINNLRQIGLAFHNYHDTYKTFPAAVQIGPKNVPHSWRITLLPFMDKGMNLYKEYRQDEPWDSENNKKVLAKMPEIYRCPLDRRDSTNASYFVFVGPETVFRSPRGAHISNITDGTSNVILAVESKREVPWTKPDEIPFDPQQPPPRLGGWHPGGFNIVLCDGSVRYISEMIDQQILKFLIMSSDGNPLNEF